jgi:hypothetical protein
MLTLKVEASLGADLRNDVMPQLVQLARFTQCRVELMGNDTLFWAHPSDTVPVMLDAYDRLYPHSRIVSTFIRHPVPRAPKPEASNG